MALCQEGSTCCVRHNCTSSYEHSRPSSPFWEGNCDGWLRESKVKTSVTFLKLWTLHTAFWGVHFGGLVVCFHSGNCHQVQLLRLDCRSWETLFFPSWPFQNGISCILLYQMIMFFVTCFSGRVVFCTVMVWRWCHVWALTRTEDWLVKVLCSVTASPLSWPLSTQPELTEIQWQKCFYRWQWNLFISSLWNEANVLSTYPAGNKFYKIYMREEFQVANIYIHIYSKNQ